MTAITGVIADLWDLNDFWYHTLAGYVMGALAIVHVLLNWGQLVAYAPLPAAGRRAAARSRASRQRQPARAGSKLQPAAPRTRSRRPRRWRSRAAA